VGGQPRPAGGESCARALSQGAGQRSLSKNVRDQIKKVTVAIQGESLPGHRQKHRNDLQQVIQLLARRGPGACRCSCSRNYPLKPAPESCVLRFRWQSGSTGAAPSPILVGSAPSGELVVRKVLSSNPGSRRFPAVAAMAHRCWGWDAWPAAAQGGGGGAAGTTVATNALLEPGSPGRWCC